MRRAMSWSVPLAVLVVAGVMSACDEAVPTEAQNGDLTANLGNGYPSPHFDYKLNIIGVPKDKTADMDNNNGRRIFVQLNSDNTVTNPGRKNNQLKGNDQNKIYLCNSTNGENDYNKDARCDDWRNANPGDFGVIDANATNADGALLRCPIRAPTPIRRPHAPRHTRFGREREPARARRRSPRAPKKRMTIPRSISGAGTTESPSASRRRSRP